jgi:hypothetical protein
MFINPEEAQARLEHAAACREDFANRMRAMLAEELTYEQMEALGVTLRIIGDAEDPKAAANYWEGNVMGAMAVRQERLGEGPQPTADDVASL